jgi:hypothetical protein
MRIGSAALIFAIALGPMVAHAAWVKGEFESGGKPVAEFHCAPSGAGPFPVVVLLQGAAARGAGDALTRRLTRSRLCLVGLSRNEPGGVIDTRR